MFFTEKLLFAVIENLLFNIIEKRKKFSLMIMKIL